MNNIYDALQSAHGKRAVPNEPNDEPTPSLPRPLKGNSPASTPRFHEESELLALAQTIATLLPNPNQRVIQFIGSQAGEGTSTLIREFALTVQPSTVVSLYFLSRLTAISHPRPKPLPLKRNHL